MKKIKQCSIIVDVLEQLKMRQWSALSFWKWRLIFFF